MRTTTLLPATIILAALVSDPAEGEAPGFTLVARTRHVSYFSEAGADHPVDVTRSEAFLGRLERIFGPAPAGWRLEYYRHATLTNVWPHAGVPPVGVADLVAGRIDSVRAFHAHELVHVVAGRVGRCPAFFAEGLAVALTSEGRWGGREIDAVARVALASGLRPGELLTSFVEQDPDHAYPLAGSFVAFLLEVYGSDAFVAFLRECGPSARRYEDAFRRAYGRTVANALIAWQEALLRGEGSRWAWADPGSWPASLQRHRGRPQTLPAALPARTARVGVDTDAQILLSIER